MAQDAAPAGAAADPEDSGQPARARRDQLVGQLAGGVAHDFNNMLATVLGCLELIERRTGEPDRQRALVKRATDAVERAADLTSALVQFARRQPEPRRNIAPAEVLAKLAPLIASALGRRVQLGTEIAPRLPASHADRTATEAALLALALAARRAMPEGGQMRLDAAPAADAERTSVVIAAEGEGIAGCDLTIARHAAGELGADLGAEVEPGRLRLTLLLPPPRSPREKG